MTIALGEFIGAMLVAFLFGGVFAVILWGGRMQAAAEHEGELHYSRGCTVTRASLRDALTTLPRLHCSRSAAGHVRVADVERLLAEVRDG